MAKPRKDIIGAKIGKLTIISHVDNNSYLVICDCGNECIKHHNSLTRKRFVASCGCLRAKHARSAARIYSAEESFVRRYYREYVRSAMRREYVFELSFEEFYALILQNCFYCGYAYSYKKIN